VWGARSYIATSQDGSGAIVPVVRGHPRNARAALERFDRIAQPEDHRRGTARNLSEWFKQFEDLQRQIMPNCFP
jgi:hypothetical protein